MKGFVGALPTRYARSLFQAALQAKCAADVESDLAAIDAVFKENRELPHLLANPSIGDAKRRGILMSIAQKLGFCEMTKRFIELLIEKGRLEILGSIPSRYHELWRDHQGEIEVTVQTAVQVSDAVKQTVTQSIATRSGKKPIVTFKVNPAIIGGIVVEYPDHVLDGSLARKVLELQKRLIARA